jgi:peptidoglycan/LPS O-acetylase OafA/YrhL
MVRYFTNDLLCGTFYAWLVLQAAIGVRGSLAPVFDNGALQYVGRISYGLYLVHNWMPDIVTRLFGPLPKYQAAPLVLAGTFGLCALSWQFFEKPVMGLKRFFGTRGGNFGTDLAQKSLMDQAKPQTSGCQTQPSY